MAPLVLPENAGGRIVSLVCKIIGHRPADVPGVPWGVICERCGKAGFFYEYWIDAAPFVQGSGNWSEMSSTERAASQASLDADAKRLFENCGVA